MATISRCALAGMVLSLGLTGIIYRACPTNNSLSLGQCVTGGGYGLWGDHFAPDATRIEQLGNETLRQWGASPQLLQDRFIQRFPNEPFRTTNQTCLAGRAVRGLYKGMVGRISDIVKGVQDSLDRAKATSELRTQARKEARRRMCNRGDVAVLELRDRATYGTPNPTFSYMVGKYVGRALKKCANGACNVKNTTCAMIMGGAKKSNQLFNWIFS